MTTEIIVNFMLQLKLYEHAQDALDFLGVLGISGIICVCHLDTRLGLLLLFILALCIAYLLFLLKW